MGFRDPKPGLSIRADEESRGNFTTARNLKVELGGVDITDILTRFELTGAAHEVTTAVLTIFPGDLEVDVDALLELQAQLRERNAELEEARA